MTEIQIKNLIKENEKEPIIIEIDNSNLDFLNKMSDRQFVIDKVEEAISSLRRK